MAPKRQPDSAQPSSHDAQRNHLLLPIASAVVVVLAAVCYLLLAPTLYAAHGDFPGEIPASAPEDLEYVPSNDKESLKSYNIIGEVPRIAWNKDRPFVLWAIDHDRPVILTNSAVLRWPALEKWTPQYLAAVTQGQKLEFKSANDPVFIYSQRKPFNKIPGFEFSRPFNLTSLDLETFWDKVSGQKVDNEPYLYFTGCITRSQDAVRRTIGFSPFQSPY